MTKKQVLIFTAIILILLSGVLYLLLNKNTSVQQSSISGNDTLHMEKRSNLEKDIKTIYADDLKKQKIAYNFAKELKKILDVKNFDELNISEFMRATDCMSFNMLGSDIGLIENLVFDTDEKMNKYLDFNDYQSGKFFGDDDLENLNCNFE